MAREGLRQLIPGVFKNVLKNHDEVTIQNIKVEHGSSFYYVDITVYQIDKPDAIRGLIMIVFTDVVASVKEDESKIIPKSRHTSKKIKELDPQLQRCYEELQITCEEMQTSQEELKSTNEELQSTNEELQSTNEELTTSKEEMQSLNEVLQTDGLMSGLCLIVLSPTILTDWSLPLWTLQKPNILGFKLTDAINDLNEKENKHNDE